MGCGCKNKSNTTDQQQINAQASIQQATATESVKTAIKKTIEKYYNVNKTNQ